jgi:hypothetical protein
MCSRKLERCPFCGSIAEIRAVESSISESATDIKLVPKNAVILKEVTLHPSMHHYVEYKPMEYIPTCIDTRCIGRSNRRFKTVEEAAAAWNRRASDDVHAAQTEEADH